MTASAPLRPTKWDASAGGRSRGVNPRTSEQIYPGLMPGGEPLWGPLINGSVPFGSNYVYYKFGVFEDPNWDYTTFDFDGDYAFARGKLGTVDSSNDPDLRDFRDRGAKLIMYHGWSDYFLAPLNTVTYYSKVVDVIAEDMENAFSGKAEPKAALDDAVNRSNALLRQFQKTAQ